MTNAQMRLEVAAMYDSTTWHQRVSKMPDNQVYAIFRYKQERDEKRKKERDLNNNQFYHNLVNDNEKEYHQIDIWEFLMEKANEEIQGSSKAY